MSVDPSNNIPLVSQAALTAEERHGVRQALGVGLAGAAALAVLGTLAALSGTPSGTVTAFLGP